uniref:Uncharacterized protein n=1 Tax=Strombidium inclinatum TaxID=197538 RepID=A0A7S3IN08_9SPIT
METNPSIVAKVEHSLKPLSYLNEHEQNHTFVECATFADDIKGKGFSDQSPWHFIDQAYFMDNFTTPVAPEKFNVTWAIGNMEYSLGQNQTNNDTGVTWALGDAFDTRLLIHYVGDIHQPLHTVTMYSPDFPTGDMGGNLFNITEKDGINELHALWDSLIYEWDDDFEQPLNETAWDTMTNISATLRDEHKWSDADIQADLKKHKNDWAAEGYEIATTFVYTIEQNTLPSDEYVSEARKIVHRRLALGGYRLAKVLETIFSRYPDVPADSAAPELKFLA